MWTRSRVIYLCESDAIEPGHNHIKHDERYIECLQSVERFPAVCGRDDAVSRLFEHRYEELACCGIVFNNEDGPLHAAQ